MAPRDPTAEQLRRQGRAAEGVREAPGGVTIKMTHRHGGAASATGLGSGSPPPREAARLRPTPSATAGAKPANIDLTRPHDTHHSMLFLESVGELNAASVSSAARQTSS